MVGFIEGDELVGWALQLIMKTGTGITIIFEVQLLEVTEMEREFIVVDSTNVT